MDYSKSVINNIRDFYKYKNYKPAAKDCLGNVLYYYDTSFYCKENSIIHSNLKQLVQCKYCCTLSSDLKKKCLNKL